MSLEFIDGFDHYTDNTHMAWKWTGPDSTNPGQGPRYGTSGYSVGNNGNMSFWSGSNIAAGNALHQSLPAVQTRVVGFGVKFHTGQNNGFFSFWDTVGGNKQIELRWNGSTGAIYVTRNGTTLGTLPTTYASDTWYFLEIKATIASGTGGSVTVRINNVVQLALTGINTQTTSNAYSNAIALGACSAASTEYVYFDDLYVLNTSGTQNNDFLGDCRVLTVLPTADGSNTAWTPNSGTNHYSRVNEANPDDDTSYVYSGTAGQIDTYTFASVTVTGVIAGVQNVISARKDDAGTRNIISECRSGGVNYDGSTSFTQGSSYAMFRQIYETDPATGSAWTQTGVNNAEFGVKCTA